MTSTTRPFLIACGLLCLGQIAYAHPGDGLDVPASLQNIANGPPPAGDKPYQKIPTKPIDLNATPTLYVVGYSHLDTQWRWSYPQVIRQFIPETMNNNFKLFEKYPNYVFNFSGSRRYEMMREYYPADYAKVKEYIKEGRWFPCGSSVDEGDSIVPNLESLVRHTLYGNNYFRKEFGVASDEFMLPDCFGFPAALPSIINHCGIRGFSTQKLTWGSANGIPFKVGNWIGPNGTSVIAALDPGAYTGSVNEDLTQSKYWVNRVQENGKQSGVYTDYHYYGTGDRGGAPADDSVHWIEHALQSKGPIQVVSSSAEDMFRTINNQQRATLPNYTGELLLTEHSAGSITSQAYMKRWNRKNELLADTAERASIGAMWLGGAPYPSKKLYDAWDLFLGSQMHDMLPGTSLPKAYEYCWNDEVLAQNEFAAVTQSGVGAIARGLDTSGQGVPIVVYNPLSVARDELVEATINLPTGRVSKLEVVGPEGKTVSSQVIKGANNIVKIAFQAKVPSVGFAVYHVEQKPTTVEAAMITEAPKQINGLSISWRGLENDRFRVTLNEAGDVSSIYDKKAKRETLKAPLRIAFLSETPGQHPAWNMDWDDRQKPPIGYVDGTPSVRMVETGPVRVALEVTRFARGSKFTQIISLTKGGQGVNFENKIDWKSQGVSLKAVFPMAVSNPLATYDAQLGTVTRPNNDPKKFEVPQHQWFDLTSTDGKYGVSVYNESKYGSDKPDDSTLRLTLLYTPDCSRGGYQDQGTQDFGRHDITYVFAPHEGDWRAGKSVWGAARLNQPLRAFQTSAHAGTLGKSWSLARISAPQVAIGAIKKAEDSDEVVVRLQELSGQPAKGVKMVFAAPIVAAREVDGQERTLKGAKVSLAAGALTTEMAPYGLRAFALKLAAPKTKLAAPRSQSVKLPYNLDGISNDSDRADGNFDGRGLTLAGEELPDVIESEGISFRTGSKAEDDLNTVTCQGQKIALPKGNWNRIYLLAASIEGDQTGTFMVGKQAISQKVQDWGGYIASFDLRHWDGDQPELTYDWPLKYTGLTPGFVKRDEVAWQCSHRHNPTRGNEFYQRSYLFKYGYNLPAGTTTLTLPKNSKIRVLAVSVARDDNATTKAAGALYDTLDDHKMDAPLVASVPDTPKNDAMQVTIAPALYGSDGEVRYTLDGSAPTLASPRYSKTIYLASSAKVSARNFDDKGNGGPITEASFTVNDTTAPKIVNALTDGYSPRLQIRFSEPVEAKSATTVGNYRLLASAAKLQSVALDADGMGATLMFSEPLHGPSDPAQMAMSNMPLRILDNRIADLAGNSSKNDARPIVFLQPVHSLKGIQTFDGQGDGLSVENASFIPTNPRAPWTINQWVYVDKQLEELTVLGGFGTAEDKSGAQRYLVKYHDSIHFWGASIDISAKTPFDVGRWQMITLTFDGQKVHIFKDGKELASDVASFTKATPTVRLAPKPPWDKGHKFEGKIADFTIWPEALSQEAITAMAQKLPQ